MDRRLISDFFHLNLPRDMEQCIELFAIFGGYDAPIDTDAPIESLLVKHILDQFDSHRERFLSSLQDNPLYLNLLHAVAIGDRREGSAFRRARIGKERGKEAFEFLRTSDYLILERSREMPLERSHPKHALKKRSNITKYRINIDLNSLFSDFGLRLWNRLLNRSVRGTINPFWIIFMSSSTLLSVLPLKNSAIYIFVIS